MASRPLERVVNREGILPSLGAAVVALWWCDLLLLSWTRLVALAALACASGAIASVAAARREAHRQTSTKAGAAADPAVYPTPGLWFALKRWVLYLATTCQRRRQAAQYSGKLRDRYDSMERLQDAPFWAAPPGGASERRVPDDAIDSFFFSGADKEGNAVLLRLARRRAPGDAAARAGTAAATAREHWISITLPGVGVLRSQLHPHTLSLRTDADVAREEGGNGRCVAGAGLSFTCVTPMSRWRVSFDGEMELYDAPREAVAARTHPVQVDAADGEAPDARDVDVGRGGRVVTVRFEFTWRADTDPCVLDEEMDAWMVAGAVATPPWSRAFCKRLRAQRQTHYEQYGQLSGTVFCDGIERHLRLRGMRDHSWGRRTWAHYRRYSIVYAAFDDGSALTHLRVNMPETVPHYVGGVLFTADGCAHPITDSHGALYDESDDGPPPELFALSFRADGRWRQVALRVTDTHVFDMGTTTVHDRRASFSLDGVPGVGFSEHCFRKSHWGALPPRVAMPPPQLTEACPVRCPLVVPFEHRAARDPQCVGGKGAQLGVLTALLQRGGGDAAREPAEWSVPTGFVVALPAWSRMLRAAGDELTSLLDRLETQAIHAIAAEVGGGSEASRAPYALDALCGDIRALIARVDDAELRDSIAAAYEALPSDTVAVRSSGVEEDGGESSSAGAMDTLLGVRGADDVWTAVRACWASTFEPRAVAYRISAGQPVNTRLAVVVQVLVRADTAGVAFTVHPVTGAADTAVVNASYGIGEGVVSGAVDPDNFEVTRAGVHGQQLSIRSRLVGAKQTRYVVEGDGGVAAGAAGGSAGPAALEERAVGSADSAAQCISEETVLSIVAVTVRLERQMGSPRDVEWAVKDGRLYLLQARPVTGATTAGADMSAAMCELDTAVAASHCVTRLNVGEMLPGSATPLTAEVFGSAIDETFWLQGAAGGARVLPVRRGRFVAAHCGHLFIDYTSVLGVMRRNCLFDKPSADLNVFGREVEQLTLAGLDHTCGSLPGPLSFVWNGANFLFNYVQNGPAAMEAIAAEAARIGDELRPGKTAAETLSKLDALLPMLARVWSAHVRCSAASGLYNAILIQVLGSGGDPRSPEVMGDVARALRHCGDVVSAGVPRDMRRLARAIVEADPDGEHFREGATDTENLAWLQGDAAGHDAVKAIFAELLNDHGHRCVKEAEFLSRSWRANPAQLLPSLLQDVATLRRASVGAASGEGRAGTADLDSVQPNVDDAIASLQTPQSYFKKLALRKLLPKSWWAVGKREWGKSAAVRFHDNIKQLWWALARQLVADRKLACAELAFFLERHEIRELVEAPPGPAVLGSFTRLAVRRRRTRDKAQKLRFPEVCVGVPRPICAGRRKAATVGTDEPGVGDSQRTITGLPVSVGSATGRAFVSRTCEEALAQFRLGDVLVCPVTDVAWSPLFTLASALVTEVGGVLSHGATVAREYGIPCVAKASGCMERIRTGDIVEVNGDSGTVTIRRRGDDTDPEE